MTWPASLEAREAAVALVRPRAAGSLTVAPPPEGPRRFHATMPGYEATPLRSAPAAAARLGVRQVLVKDESARLGLPSFKVLGASWAVYRALLDRLGLSADEIDGFAGLESAATSLSGGDGFTLSAATDGNHGHAVAHMAALLGLAARMYVPANTVQPRIDAIVAEGATVTVVDGGYQDAVDRSAQDAGERCLVISDTSWEGYDEVPAWVIEGYSTILTEIEDEGARPDVVAIPIGVGAFAAAVIRHFWGVPERRPRLVGVEPTSAACVLESVAAGRVSTLEHEQDSIMAGLNCATPSLVAWPLVSEGIDVYLAVPDERVPEAMRLLARDGIVAGETGAAGLAGMLALADDGALAPAREAAGLGPEARVLLLCTEGATDPDAYRRLVGEHDR